MAITEIFTGHVLDLSDIKAVSDIVMDKKQSENSAFVHKTLYLEIYLAGGSVLRYNHFFMTHFSGHVDETERTEWQNKVDSLKAKRKELLEQWSQAVGKTLQINSNEPENID
jgi:hypothetical protein